MQAMGTRVYLKRLTFHKVFDLSAVSIDRGCMTRNAILNISDVSC